MPFPICPTCGYSLVGQAIVDEKIRCPECGQNQWSALCTRGPTAATTFRRVILGLLGLANLIIAYLAWKHGIWWLLGACGGAHLLVGLTLGRSGWDADALLEGGICYCLAALLIAATSFTCFLFSIHALVWLPLTALLYMIGVWIGTKLAPRSASI